MAGHGNTCTLKPGLTREGRGQFYIRMVYECGNGQKMCCLDSCSDSSALAVLEEEIPNKKYVIFYWKWRKGQAEIIGDSL